MFSGGTPYRSQRNISDLHHQASSASESTSGRSQPVASPDHSADLLVHTVAAYGLLKKTWHTYSVSPLFNFETSHQQLRRLSQSLIIQLERDLCKKGVDTDECYNAKVSLLKLGRSEGEQLAVMFTVGTKRKGEDNPIFAAVLCCVDSRQETMKGFVDLPLLLVRGPVTIQRCFIPWLEAHFDCHTSPLHFSSVVLAALSLPWLSLKANADATLELVYSMPSAVQAEGLQCVTLTISANDGHKLWKKCQESAAVENESVWRNFLAALHLHIELHFHLRLEAAHLSRISTHLAHISTAGQIKMLSEEAVGHVLGGITHVVQSHSSFS